MSLLADNIIIEMSEQVNENTVNCDANCGTQCLPGCGNVVVTDSNGNIVEGTVYLAPDRKTIVFVPKYGYKYATDYTITIDGVKDQGGNLLTGYTSSFRTFEPVPFATVPGVSNTMAIDKYTSSVDGKDYLLVTGAYTDSNGNVLEDSGLVVVDVSDPEHPVERGAAHTAGFDRDVKALPNVSFTDHAGNTTTGDFAVVVGGSASTIGYLNLMDVTDPGNPYRYEWLYLSWNPTYSEFAPANVPYAGGMPYRVELLGQYAYVVNTGLGIQAIDLTKVTPIHTDAQREAIVGTISEPSYRGISKVVNIDPAKSLILATKNHTLSIIDPSLNIISEVTTLNLPYEVTGVEAFPIDVDGDGNLGSFEDNDIDTVTPPITSADETFDLAFVSTSDGVVIVNLNDPTSPVMIATIPLTCNGTAGLPGKVVVNRAKRLAYVSMGDSLYAISLMSMDALRGVGLKDGNGDCMDDRIASVLKNYTYVNANGQTVTVNYTFSDGVIEMDSLGRELLYEITGDGVRALDLNVPRLKVALLDANGRQLFYDKRVLINNNNSGDPEMPVIKARIMPVDPRDQNQLIYVTDPNLNAAEVCWSVKVEYKVPLKVAYRSRLGFSSMDGFMVKNANLSSPLCPDGIKTVGPELNIDNSGPITWDGNFGGGILTITPSILKNGMPKVDLYTGTIEGERTTDQFRNQMITYLKLKGQALVTDLGSSDVLFALACVETYGINHFYPPVVINDKVPDGSEYGLPIGSNYPIENRKGDGGFGVMQLTNPSPIYRKIWHWKDNVDAGVYVVKTKIDDASTGARDFPKRWRKKYPAATDFTPEQMRMDVYSQYRGRHYWKWDYDSGARKYGWVRRLDINDSDYQESGVCEADKARTNEGQSSCKNSIQCK